MQQTFFYILYKNKLYLCACLMTLFIQMIKRKRRKRKTKLTLSQAKQAMAQRALQPLQTLLAVSLTGAGEGDSVEFDVESVLDSLSSHLKGLLSAEEGW